ncbi:MAG: dephospho-CoA kinase [Firmicutes bacterium]|nr:dephospho-CoA kinase [Bacillota bacterium]
MIGLTGGIASGKSTVSKMLKELGAYIIDADKLAREVVLPNQPGWERVKEEFPEVIGEDGTIDRKKLGQIVFVDPGQRKKLEQIIHPLVLSIIQERGRELEQEGKIVVADIPLLFETNSETWLDEVWLVYVDLKTQLERLINRDQLTEEEAMLRINAQMSLEEKKKLADEVIDNTQGLGHTFNQVNNLWRRKVIENCIDRS